MFKNVWEHKFSESIHYAILLQSAAQMVSTSISMDSSQPDGVVVVVVVLVGWFFFKEKQHQNCLTHVLG